MADTVLDILVTQTYDVNTLGVNDVSMYGDTPPVITAPTIEITPPGFSKVVLPFTIEETNVFNSMSLGLSSVGDPLMPLPDGVYFLKYSISPSFTYFVEKSIMRVDKIQEKFDAVFMKLDMMECDRAIKTQAKVDLMTVYFFIQGAIAAANNCAIIESNSLYATANKMLNNMIGSNCGCSGTNYFINLK